MLAMARPQAETRVPLELQAVFLESSQLGTIEEAPIPEAKHGRLVFVRRWLKNHQYEQAPKTPITSSQAHSQSTDTDRVDIADSPNSPNPNGCDADESESRRKRQDTSPVRRSASAPVTSKPPPSALKTKPRIPLELQAVFLESCRDGVVDRPAPETAHRIFGVRWSPRKKKPTPRAESDGKLDRYMPSPNSSSNFDATKPRRCQLNFGDNETILFEKRKPTNTRFQIDKTCCTRPVKQQQPRRLTLCRWSSGLDQKEATLSSIPRAPRRCSNEFEGKSLEPVRCA